MTGTNEASCQADDAHLVRDESDSPVLFPRHKSFLRTRIRPISLTPELIPQPRSPLPCTIVKKCVTPKLKELTEVPVLPVLPLPFLKKATRRRKERKTTVLPPLSPYRFLEVEGVAADQSYRLESFSPYRRKPFRFPGIHSRVPSHHISKPTLRLQDSP